MLVLIAVFSGIAALALLLQSVAFLAIARSMRSVSVRVDRLGSDLSKTVGNLSDKTEDLMVVIRGIAGGIQALQDNLTSTSEIIQKRVSAIDSFLDETTDKARLQVLRIEAVVESISGRVEETFDLLHSGVIAPAAELSALIKGIRAGLDFLAHRRRRPAGSTHQDEEMFI